MEVWCFLFRHLTKKKTIKEIIYLQRLKRMERRQQRDEKFRWMLNSFVLFWLHYLDDVKEEA